MIFFFVQKMLTLLTYKISRSVLLLLDYVLIKNNTILTSTCLLCTVFCLPEFRWTWCKTLKQMNFNKNSFVYKSKQVVLTLIFERFSLLLVLFSNSNSHQLNVDFYRTKRTSNSEIMTAFLFCYIFLF